MALAVTLAAAKVILSTVGVALFLAKQGPAQLPLFYVLLALLAILLSGASSGAIDRMPKLRLGQVVFLAILLAAASLRIPIALDLPAAYYAVLAAAHIYEIVLDIVFWVVVAAFLDAIELKRGTTFIYMALAAGGGAGGALTASLSPLLPAENLLLALPILALIAAAQFELARRRLHELPDPHHAEADAAGPLEKLRLLPRQAARYPLLLLIALNALMLTILYGLSEYLVFTVYAESFQGEAALTRFLALMFAAIQVLEFALLYVVSRPLLERAGPLARNLVFPLTSLACLIGFAAGQKLPVAIATHLNAEAISNAVFQPVNNTNYVALPLRMHGRARTLADGIFYPGGLAIAGIMLLSLQNRLELAQVTFIALVFASIFILINVGVGVLYLPTLVRNLRSGVDHFAELARGGRTPPATLANQVRDLLRSADPEARAIGLDRADKLDPALCLAELRQLAPVADRTTRRRLSGLLGRGSPERLRPLVDELLDGDDAPGQLIALQIRLALGEGLTARQAERLAGSPCRSVVVLASLAAAPALRSPGAPTVEPGRLAEILPWCRDGETAADVIDACAQTGRADLAELLIGVIGVAPPEQQRQGLAVLPVIVRGEHAGAAALARSLVRHHDVQLRAEAIAVLGAVGGSPRDLEALAAALGDRSRVVRQRAADALAARGDRATAIAAAKLTATDPGVVEAAIRALGRIGTRGAAASLTAMLKPIARAGVRNLAWLRRLPRGPEQRAWLALELTLLDHNRRIVDLVLNVLAALGAGRSVADLRHSLTAADQRTRANALEVLLALPQRRLVQPILPLLEATYAGVTAAALPPQAAWSDPMPVLAAALRSSDLWVRCGAAHTARALARASGAGDRGWMAGAEAPGSPPAGPPLPLTVTELAMDQVLLLKRIALFRHLPLDTLLAVSQVLERREYLAGETILEAGTRSDHFWIVASGAVDLVVRDGAAERLTAPAHFGELVLADERVRAPRIVAAQDCALLRLHRILFQDLSRDYPDMLMELCRLLARRLRRSEAMAEHGAQPGPARAAAGSQSAV